MDTAIVADPADVVAGQVHEHQMLGPLFFVGEELRFERAVFLRRLPAPPRAGDRADFDIAVLAADVNLR